MAYVTLSSKAIGSTIKLKVNGSARNFIVVHQGKPSSVYDDSCNGTWLLMQDIYENRAWHSSNTNDYANSTIHSYLNSTFLNLFESNIKNAIKQVKLPYRKGSGTSTTVTSGSNGLSAKIFLLSATETSFDFSYMPSGEGAELAYFKGCEDNSSDSKRIANLNGSVAPLSALQLLLQLRPVRQLQWRLELRQLLLLERHPPRFDSALFSLGV